MYWYDKLVDLNEKLVVIGIGILILLTIILFINIIKTISLDDIKKNNDLIVMQNTELKEQIKKINEKLDK